MQISSPIKNSVGKKEGNNLVFSCQTNSEVFSPLKGKTTTGTTTTTVEILSEDNNYILQVYNVTNSLGSDKILELGAKLGTSKENKITLRLYKNDKTYLDANQYYDSTSENSEYGTGEKTSIFQRLTAGIMDENFNLEVNRIKQLLK